MEGLRVSAISKGHEGKEVPVIVGCWIRPLLDAEPALNLRTPAVTSVSDIWGLSGVLGAPNRA